MKVAEEKLTFFENEVKEKDNRLRSNTEEITNLQCDVSKLQTSESHLKCAMEELENTRAKLDSDLTRLQAEHQLLLRVRHGRYDVCDLYVVLIFIVILKGLQSEQDKGFTLVI